MTATQPVLKRVFNVLPGEGERAGLLWLFAFLAIGGVIITGQLASRSLFLSQLPRSLVPLKFVLPPLALVVTASVYARLAGRFRRVSMVAATCLGFAALVVGFRLMLATPLGAHVAVLCALFVVFDVASSLVMLQFWTLAGDLFDAREAKRLFGVIATSSTFAAIGFGVGLARVSRNFGPENLLVLMALCLLACAAIVVFLGRRYAPLLAQTDVPQTREGVADRRREPTPRELLRQPLVVSMAGIIMLVALVGGVGEFQLDLALQREFGGDGAAMVAFLGDVRFVAGLLALFMQLFVANRLLERFGVVAALLMLPIAIVLGSFGVLLTGGALLAVATPRTADAVLKYTVHDSSFNLLYLPVPPDQRAQMKALLDGIVKPIVLGLLGVSFFFATRSITAGIVGLSVVVLALAAAWIVLVVRASRQYVTALADSVSKRRFDVGDWEMNLHEPTAVRVLATKLQSPDAALVTHALALIEGAPEGDWTPHVVPLLAHPSPEVQVLACGHLARVGDRAHLEAIRPLLASDHIEVRAAAIKALCRLAPRQGTRPFLAHLKDPDPRLRGAAVVGLIRNGGLQGMVHASMALQALFESPDPEARVEGARVLDEIQVVEFSDPLVALLQDSDSRVRLAAVEASVSLAAAELAPHLLGCLADPLTRPAAEAGLARAVSGDLSLLAAALDDPSLAPSARSALPRVLERIGNGDAAALLIVHLLHPDLHVRFAVHQSLREMRSTALAALHGAALRAALRAEVRGGLLLEVMRNDLGPRSAELLAGVLDERRMATMERQAMLLAVIYPDLPARSLAEALVGGDKRIRANALELLDNVVDADLRGDVLTMFGGDDAGRLALAEGPYGIRHANRSERLRAMLETGDAFLRAVALDAIRQDGDPAMRPLVVQSLADADPLVREVASVARRTLDPHPEDSDMGLSTIEKLLFLKSVPLFERIGREALVGLTSIAHEVGFQTGEMVIRTGDPADCLYIIVDGRVSVQIEGEQKMIVEQKGILGELGVLSNSPRRADCVAMEETIALRLGKEDFWALLEQRPEITMGVLREVVHRYL